MVESEIYLAADRHVINDDLFNRIQQAGGHSINFDDIRVEFAENDQ